MDKKVLFVLLDGMRSDYIDPENTPFLNGLISSSLFVQKLKKSAPFCERSEIFSGHPGKTTGNYSAFRMTKTNSPYRLLKNYKQICTAGDWLCFDLPRAIGGKAGNFLYRGFKKLRKSLFQRYFAKANGAFQPNDIPAKFLPYFMLGEDTDFVGPNARCYQNSIFEKMEAAGVKYIDFFDDLRIKNRDWTRDKRLELIRDAFKNEYDLYMFADSEIDAVGHLVGTNMGQMCNVLKKVDNLMEGLHSEFKECFDDGLVIYFSPHGMRCVEETFDAESSILNFCRKRRIKIPQDIIYFLDSTMVRVWGPKSHEFVDLFKSAEWCRNGSYVDEKLQLEFNFPLNLEEKIWWANPGVCVFPDFFRRNSPPKGMHGYSMDDPLMSGFMIANGADVAPNLISEGELVRLFDTLVELFYSDRSLGTDRNSFLKP